MLSVAPWKSRKINVENSQIALVARGFWSVLTSLKIKKEIHIEIREI